MLPYIDLHGYDRDSARMTVNDFISLIKGFIDVLLVWLVIYYCLKSLRKHVKMVLLFKGILIIFFFDLNCVIKILLNYGVFLL